MSNPIPTLVQTIEAYDPERATAEINRFRKMQSLVDAIKTAAESRKENGHPYEHQQRNWNFWPHSIRAATKLLINACDEFDECF